MIGRVEVLGTLRAKTDEGAMTRFRTRGVGLLLGYLAYHRRSHPRDELAEMLWPDTDIEIARRRLRLTLSYLRHHLEPPSTPPGSVLETHQGLVSLNTQSVTVDVAEFEKLVQSAAQSPTDSDRLETLRQAIDLYKGELMPGYFEDWIQEARIHLEDLFVSALQSATHICEAEGRIEEGIRYARMAVDQDPFNEEAHASLMRLYLVAKRPARALRQAQDLQANLASELNEEPSAKIKALVEKAKQESEILASTALETEFVASEPGTPVVEGPIVRLPTQLNQFFGRSAERDLAIERLATYKSRLVTLLGPGGIGKTRLAVEVGQTMALERGWNVWFVPLADISQASGIPHAILEAMRIRRGETHSPIEAIRASLVGRNNLLILDNLEHILEEAIPLIRALLVEIPGISCLATSRHSLKTEGEHEVDLTTLSVPSLDASEPFEESDLAAFVANPSVQLFADRAQAVRADFEITVGNAATVASICQKLDGLPLALEIAASLVGAFSLDQLSASLESRLDLLYSRRRDLSGRHQSLRAMIDYSYELLTPEQQAFFAGLSVFRGGFAVDAASQICVPEGDSTTSQRMIFDLLERSLIMRAETLPDESPRFRLLESFREFGDERLDPEAKAAIRDRHARFYSQWWADQAKDQSPQFGRMNRSERENRLAAIEFFFDEGRRHECVGLLESFYGLVQGGQETIRALLKPAEFQRLDVPDQISVLLLSTDLYVNASQFEMAYRECEAALKIANDHGLQDEAIKCLRVLSGITMYVGVTPERIQRSREVLAYEQSVGNFDFTYCAYINLAANLWSIGDYDGAKATYLETLAAAREARGDNVDWRVYRNLAQVHYDLGDLDEALQFAGAGLRNARETNNTFGIALCLAVISRYHCLCGNLQTALEMGREAIILCQKVGFPFWTVDTIHGHAVTLTYFGDYEDAASLLAVGKLHMKGMQKFWLEEFQRDVSRVKEKLSEQAFAEAWARGLLMSVDDAYRLAIRRR